MFVTLFILDTSYTAKNLEGNWNGKGKWMYNDPSDNSTVALKISHDVRCEASTNSNLQCIMNNFTVDGTQIPDDTFPSNFSNFEVALEGNVLVIYDTTSADEARGVYYGANNIVYWENNNETIDFIWTRSGMLCRYVHFREI